MSEKIQKFLAGQGIASRRKIEAYIQSGRIKVNGEPAHIGQRVSSDDDFSLDGERITLQEPTNRHRVLLFHKPVGLVSSRSDEKGRKTVFDGLPALDSGRWISVGRLDIDTSGLLLFTTDGELANRLMHPKYAIPRRYVVSLDDNASVDSLQALKEGIELDDGLAKFTTLEKRLDKKGNEYYVVELCEGRNREVRRMWQAVGHRVIRLKRTQYGVVVLPKALKKNNYEDCNHSTLDKLYKSVSMEIIK